MCGIVGIASAAAVTNRSWLAVGRDALVHRGPDDAGEWWSPDGRVGLAHRRLAILDLSPAGHQPMHDATATLTIVFNGEIYNFTDLRCELQEIGFVFSSHSDTEVILAAYRQWGATCIQHLNGMFAFAIYDSERQTVLLARDRAGEKPLFYHRAGGTLRFASELKALMADPDLPRRVDRESLDFFLAIGHVSGERCILQGFSKLPPAHALLFHMTSGRADIWRYWQPPDLAAADSNVPIDEDGLLGELETLLEDSVRRQLIADVPVGVLLSGGVDSSLITAMASRVTAKVKTFTIRFPGHGGLDETEHARLIARQFGTEHIELEARATTADLVPRLAKQFDEPMLDSSMIPTFLVSELVRRHCKVALGGDGGDELFGGYTGYDRMLWMKSRLGKIPGPVRRLVSTAAERLLPLGVKGRNWLLGLGADLEHGLPLIGGVFTPSSRKRLMSRYGRWPVVAESILEQQVPNQADLLQRATRMDFADYLAEDILVKVDRASMLNSLEVRAPFLDYRLVEFAFGKVPSNLKATVHDKKILLKRLAARVLPAEFDRQRKQGFSIPLPTWLKGGPFRELFQDVLSGPDVIFDRRTVSDLWRGQDRGRSNSERLFALVLFELWRREYRVSLG